MLTDTAIRGARPMEKPYKLTDGRGMHLLVTPHGSRIWQLRYRYKGRPTMISLGKYPEVSLKEARLRREAERLRLAQGIDPAQARREAKIGESRIFEGVAREWLAARNCAKNTRGQLRNILRQLSELLGRRSLAEIEIDHIRAAILQIERTAPSLASRAARIAARVLRYGRGRGYGGKIDLLELREEMADALGGYEEGGLPGIIDPARAGELIRQIDAYTGAGASAVCAARVLPRVFCRPSELYGAMWKEIDLEGGIWRIPAERTKPRRPHLVPLSHQVIELLKAQQLLTGDGRYVFASWDAHESHIARNTVSRLLKALGFSSEEHVPHGFRTTASTLLHELGAYHQAIEAQLQHRKPGVQGLYDLAEHLPVRTAMMQAWSDYLDALKTGSPFSAATVFRASIQSHTSRLLQATVASVS